MSDALLSLLGVNIAVAVAVALVMALRLPVRRLFGPRVAYGLWSLVPLSGLALLLPSRVVTVAAPAAPRSAQMVFETGPAVGASAASDLFPLLAALWFAGGLASLAWLVWRQAQFGRAARHGLAGPAVIGLLRPRIITPFDFARRYTPREQLVVLAHEATHIRRHDTLANAAVALAACVNWFNPAMHILARYVRIDQEFACDAQVMAAHPTARRSYAEAMLKTQLASRALPLGCYWPASSPHPLAQRIQLLAHPDPGQRRRRLGTAAIALLGLIAAGTAWAARPARVVAIPLPAPATLAPQSEEALAPAKSAQAPLRIRPTGPASAPAAADPVSLSAAQSIADQAIADARIAPDPPEMSDAPAVRNARIHAVARRSAVAPGSAVRVLATMIDPQGKQLTTDLTAFGSQSVYRSGWFQRNGSRLALFTSVVQDGDRLKVTASLGRRFEPWNSGSIVLATGQTGQITLADGQVITVTPTVRRETPEEVEDGQRAMRNARGPKWPAGGWTARPADL